MKKAGILSMQRIYNYGSFLQAYALKKMMEECGAEVEFVDYHPGECILPSKETTGMKRKIQKGLEILRMKGRLRDKIQFVKYKKNYARKNYPVLGLKETYNYAPKLDLLVIGSDEVFNCIQDNSNVGFAPELFGAGHQADRLVSYAASFGKGEWLLDSKETEETKLLASNFIAISVRERSAVDLCRNYWGIDAKHVLDPALLLDAEDYLKTITLKRESNILFAYVLDESSLKRDIVEAMANSRKLKIYRCMPKEELINGVTKNLDNCIYPPVDNWLNGFNNATCVVTDSFHGVVFSIIFRKPFVVIGNTQRGMARFESLLTMLGLENRMVKDVDSAIEMMDISIDYESVYAILKCKRCEALNFLSQISE